MVTNLFALTFRAPRDAARQLLAMRYPARARWLGLALVAVLSVIAQRFYELALPRDGGEPFGGLLDNPVAALVFEVVTIVLPATVMTFAGRLFRGQGRFDDALLLMVWLGFVLTIVGAVQVLLLVVATPVGVIFSLLAVLLFLWLLVNFTAALHGFSNLWLVFAGAVATFLAIGFALALIVGAFGIDPTTWGIVDHV